MLVRAATTADGLPSGVSSSLVAACSKPLSAPITCSRSRGSASGTVAAAGTVAGPGAGCGRAQAAARDAASSRPGRAGRTETGFIAGSSLQYGVSQDHEALVVADGAHGNAAGLPEHQVVGTLAD